MLACVLHGANDLRVEALDVPAPRNFEVEVAVRYGGICGSDLHYWHRGAVGDFRIRQPMVLGHEIVGVVSAIGAHVARVKVGDPVAVHPATVCGQCPECRAGRPNVCREVRYLGSAARFPHVQGGFRGRLVIPADQARPLPDGLDTRRATVTEPLAVALHAVRRAGEVAGRRLFIAGAGPIGLLVAAAARAKGAAEIVVSDLLDEPLALARAIGATGTVRADADPADWPVDFDVAIEASGSAPGLASCAQRLRPGGVLVQLGMFGPGDVPVPVNLFVTRECDLRGAFRFHQEFDDALALLAAGLDIEPLISATIPLASATEAFALASDRTRASKVLLDLDGAA
jgi:L-idonate 5-dehydrogenase